VSAYSDAVLALSPLAYWRLNETSGTVADNAEGTASRDMAYVNTPTLGATGLLATDDDKACYFAGGEYAYIDHAISTVQQNFTVMGWFKPVSISQQALMLYNGDSAAGGWGLAQISTDFGNPGAQLVGLYGGVQWMLSGWAFSDTTSAHFIVMTRDTVNTRFYVDGVLAPYGATAGPASPLNGTDWTTISHGWSGTVDEVAIFESCLSAANIAALYELGRPVTTPVVQATATGGVNSSPSPHSVNLPSGIVAGELLVVVWSRICFASVTSVTTPSGWTQATGSPAVQGWGGSGETIRVYYKTATGSEGSTISMAFDDNSGQSAWSGYRTYRIAGANLAGPALITAAMSGEGGGYSPDPPSNSPGSTKDWLWLAVAYNYSATFTNGPSGYSNYGEVEGGYCKSAFAEKGTINTSSENPGAFALDSWGKWGAATIAIAPFELTGVGAIASAEAFGQTELVYNRELVGVGGIASAEAFGLAQILAIKGLTVPAISAFTGTHAWSVAAWAKWTSKTAGRVFSVWDSGGNELASLCVVGAGYSSANRAGDQVLGAANDGYYHLYVATYDGVTLRFYIDGRVAGADVASSTSLAAAAGARAGSGYQGINPFGGSIDDVAVFDYYLSASQVAGLYVSGTTSGVDLVHDSSGASIILAGWQPHAYMAGYAAVDTYSTALDLAANGGSIAIPIQLEGKMALRQVSLWNTDTATARSWNWNLYYQPRQDSISNVLFRVAVGSLSAFTPTVASKRSLEALGAPALLGPGSYWLVIQNTHATSTFGLGSIASGPLSLNRAQTKTLPVVVGATLDFTLATWTKVTAIYAVILEGDVLGLWGAY
jgi:hypothetical protein